MKKVLYKFTLYCTLFVIGAMVYLEMEMIWRGHTHWTMGILGGLSLIFIGLIDEVSENLPLLVQAPIASIIITLLEYFAGVILNINMGLDIWDYSRLPFNVDGQVCLLYSIIWMFVGMFAVWLDNMVRWKIFHEPMKNIRFI